MPHLSLQLRSAIETQYEVKIDIPGVTLPAASGERWAVRILLLSDPAASRKLLSPVRNPLIMIIVARTYVLPVEAPAFIARNLITMLFSPRRGLCLHITQVCVVHIAAADSRVPQLLQQHLMQCASSDFVGQ